MRNIVFVHDRQVGPNERKILLENAGYNVILTQKADECLELCSEVKPDLVIADILIEGRTGFELTRELRFRYRPEELPILLCSTIYRARAFRDEATQCGADRYLLQPIDSENLLETVSELLDGPERQERGAA